MKTIEFFKRHKSIIPYILIWVSFLLLGSKIVSQGDDLVFADGIHKYGSLGGWVAFFFKNWGGRIVPQGFLILLLQLPEIVFHIVDASMWFVLLLYADKLFNEESNIKRPAFMILFAVLIFTMIPTSCIVGTAFWKCANVLYVWGTALAFVAIYPLTCLWRNREIKAVDVIVAIPAGIYASSFEQIAVIMSLILIALLVGSYVKYRKIPVNIIILTALICMCSLFFCIAPGNAVRVKSETIWWFQEFGAFSLFDKVIIGLSYAIENVEREIPIVLFAISALLLAFDGLRKEKNITFKLTSFVTTLYFLLNYIYRLQTVYTGPIEKLGTMFRTISPYSMEFDLPSRVVMAEVVNVSMIAILCVNVGMVILDKFDLFGFSIIVGAFASLASMGFSPTIYASEGRPRFVGYILLILTACSLIAKMVKTVIVKKDRL